MDSTTAVCFCYCLCSCCSQCPLLTSTAHCCLLLTTHAELLLLLLLLLLQVLSALDDDWFIKPHKRQQALLGAQSAAAAAAVAAAAAAEAGLPAAPPLSPSTAAAGFESPGSAFGLRPEMIDTDRIEQMAVLDSTLVWFLAEMEASPEPRQVVLKWALHPTIGPKLKGNAWLEKLGLQQPLAGVYSRLRALEYAAQL
jgi:hypothetical protein